MKAKAFAKFNFEDAARSVKELRQQFATDDTVLVGIPAGITEKTGESTAAIAAVHEFGSEDGRIPERSFMRAGILFYRNELRARAKDDLLQVAQGRMSMLTALERLGLAASSNIKRYIRSSGEGTFAPLAPATIAAKTVGGKAGTKPLIDTGNMMQSITYVVGAKR